MGVPRGLPDHDDRLFSAIDDADPEVCAAVLVVSVIYSLRNRTLVERATVAQADVQRAFIETFSGIETVKSLNLESHCYDRWSARLGAQLDYQTRQGRLSALLSSLSSALVFVVAAMRGRLRHDLRGTRHARTGCPSSDSCHWRPHSSRHSPASSASSARSWRSPPICARFAR